MLIATRPNCKNPKAVFSGALRWMKVSFAMCKTRQMAVLAVTVSVCFQVSLGIINDLL